jgi:hypothetical protein
MNVQAHATADLEWTSQGGFHFIIDFYFSMAMLSAVCASAAKDIPLIAVAFAVIMTFTGLMLFVKDTVHSKLSLSIVAVATVALSIGAAFGLSLYMSIPFTGLSQVCFSALLHLSAQLHVAYLHVVLIKPSASEMNCSKKQRKQKNPCIL